MVCCSTLPSSAITPEILVVQKEIVAIFLAFTLPEGAIEDPLKELKNADYGDEKKDLLTGERYFWTILGLI